MVFPIPIFKDMITNNKTLSSLNVDELLELYSSNVTPEIFTSVENEIIKRLTKEYIMSDKTCLSLPDKLALLRLAAEISYMEYEKVYKKLVELITDNVSTDDFDLGRKAYRIECLTALQKNIAELPPDKTTGTDGLMLAHEIISNLGY